MTSSFTTVYRRPSPTVVALLLALFATATTFGFANARKDIDDDSPKRNRDHFDEILLRPDPHGYDDNSRTTQQVLQTLRQIYHEKIRPLEEHFHYADLERHVMTDADIHAKPIVLVVGPWSTGKSTLINYILGIEDQLERLYTGAEPTTADFTVLSYGDDYRTVEGLVLATDPTKPFSAMEKFGQTFLEHLLGIEINAPLLRNVTFIDTPGILENRRQQERGYPYNDVMRWLVHRADLIFVVFDPTKLDVGYELETLFKQLKGKESVIRIILNKADSISEQELMRVYGALFWSLSPLINVTEAPRVYVGSFWSEPYTDDELGDILEEEEKSLLNDMYEVIRNRIYNKIAFLRQHAIRVRIHALLIDSYVAAYRKNKGFFKFSDEELAKKIAQDPVSYYVYKSILSHPNVSEYDLPDPHEYEEFFQINPLAEQSRIDDFRSYFAKKGHLEKINEAISFDLPKLLQRYQLLGELDNSKGPCRSKKGGMPCFSDIGSDLWAMQKRSPSSRKFASDEMEDIIITSRSKSKQKYRKTRKQTEESEEEEEEGREEEISESETEETETESLHEEDEEQVDIEEEVVKPPTKTVKTEQPKQAPSSKITYTVKKGKPKPVVVQKEEEEEEESEEEENVEVITKPARTVSVSERIEEPQKPVEKIVTHVRETAKTESVEQVQSKRADSEGVKIAKQKLDDSKMTQTEETRSATENVVKPKLQTAPTKEKRATDDEVQKRDTGKPKVAQPKPTDDENLLKIVAAEDSITLAPIPAAHAGTVKKPHSKGHPTVEELIDEDNKKAQADHPCSPYRKVCRPKTEQPSFFSLTEKLSSFFVAEETEKPKCKIYRKSCQRPSDEESPKVEHGTKKHPPKKEPVKPTKAEPVVEEPKEEERKCLPYRKTCVPVKREPVVVKVKDTSCKLYRKSCKVETEEEQPPAKKPAEKVKVKEEAKQEEKSQKAKEKSKKSTTEAKEEIQQKAPPPKEKPKKPKSEEIVEKKAKKVEKEEKISKTPEKSKASSEKSKEEKSEEEEEKPLSAKFRYRKLREDLPEHLKQKYIDKLETFFKQAEVVSEEKAKPKKCPIYRKSCKAEHHESMLFKTGDFVEEIAQKFQELLSFTEHFSFLKIRSAKPKGTKKCLPYRKSCAGKVAEEGEEEVEEVVLPKCKIYRKSCKQGEVIHDESVVKVKPKREHPASKEHSEEEHGEKSGEVHESGSDENGIESTSKRQAYDSREEEKQKEREEAHAKESRESAEKKKKEKSVEVKAETAHSTYRKKNIASATTAPPMIEKKLEEKEIVEEKILTAKERYRKKSAEEIETSAKKSTAKSEESKSNEMTAKEKYRKQKPNDVEKTMTDKSKESAETSKGKCPPYRKSCQDVSSAENIEPPVTVTKKESTPEAAVKILTSHETETNCLPYRKTCVLKGKMHSTGGIGTLFSFDFLLPDRRHSAEISVKCLPYRKSCKIPESEATVKKEDKATHHDKFQKTTIESKHVVGQKCLPYRKSCTPEQLPTVDEHTKISGHKRTDVHTPADSSTRESTTPCLPYRKSCTGGSKATPPTTAKKNLTNKDIIYVIDKETGKQKKLCRKKKNGDSNGNANVPSAEILTSKIHNKWRKSAQVDSVIAA